MRGKWIVKQLPSLMDIPMFSPDAEATSIVEELREGIANANGVIISSPEYAAGVPGALKNALDWCVSTVVFSDKPVAVITAASLGDKAHESLLATLTIIQSSVKDETNLLISGAGSKVRNGVITDENTLHQLDALLSAFDARLKN